MECVKIDLPKELSEINIEIFSDLHLGSKKCDFKLIHERIAKVKESENTYAIIVGDVCNNSTKDSVGDTYEEELTPMEQIKQAITLFEPIGDKILGIVSGNHEHRSYKKEGIDLLYFLASQLNIQDRYNPTGLLLFIRFGEYRNRNKRKVLYTLYMTHGSAGGKLIGGKANGLSRIGNIVSSDIVVVGHTHMPMTFRESSFIIDEHNSGVYRRESVFVNASATLDYEEYAETFGFKPNSKQSPVIHLSGKKKYIEVTL